MMELIATHVKAVFIAVVCMSALLAAITFLSGVSRWIMGGETFGEAFGNLFKDGRGV